MESIAKLMSGDRLPHFGPFPSWNFAPWNHHAPHSIPEIDLKWDCRSSTQSFATGSLIQLFKSSLFFLCVLSVSVVIYIPSAIASKFEINKSEQSRIADLIFKNECSRKFNCLVSWNDGEDFASLGIGHFIWFPKGSNAPFQESFPNLLRWLKKHHVVVPDELQHILKPNQPCPWQTKQEFLKPESQAGIQALRQFLADTKDVQASFMMQRLAHALPKMLKVGKSDVEKQKIKQQFERVARRPNGWYVLIDYVNFKGEGTSVSERYEGKGWGLAQVLLAMHEEQEALSAFADAAKRVLTQRVHRSPPERGEIRWLKGWFKRINTYSLLKSSLARSDIS